MGYLNSQIRMQTPVTHVWIKQVEKVDGGLLKKSVKNVLQ